MLELGYWNVAQKYVNKCNEIFLTLLSLSRAPPPIICEEISEFSATKYLPCIRCDNLFGFTECKEDFFWGNISSARVCIDEHDEVRYFLNYEPEISGCCMMEEDEDEDEIEVLCKECADEWNCTLCGYQALEYNYDTEIAVCIVCKKSVCRNGCAHRTKWCPNDATDEERRIYGVFMNYSICSLCNDDQTVTDQVIEEKIKTLETSQ